MELYISKSALVAELERRIEKYTKRGEESDAKRDGYGMYWGGVLSCLNEIKALIKETATYNGDIVEGVFLGWHYPIEKLVKKESIELEVIELASEDFVNEPNRYPHEGVFLVKTPNGKLIVKVGHDFEGNSEVSEPIPIY